MAEATQRARLRTRYDEEIRAELQRRFGYSTPMQAPKIEKITLNMGVGDAKQDLNFLEAATTQLATIAGQKPSVRRARKSIAAFKLREGMPVGVSVTLRGDRGYEFLDRLMSIAIPRIRDFRGLNPRSFDGRGNYSLGIREQVIFPEIDYDAVDQIRGLDVTITTSARTDEEAFALLEAFGMPFARENRPEASSSPAAEADASAEPEPGGEPEEPQAGADASTAEPDVTSEPEEPQAEADNAAAEPEAAGEPAAGVEEQPQPEADTATAERVESAEAVPAESADGGPAESADAAPAESADDAPAESADAAPAESAEDTAPEPADAAPADSADDAPAEPKAGKQPEDDKPSAGENDGAGSN